MELNYSPTTPPDSVLSMHCTHNIYVHPPLLYIPYPRGGWPQRDPTLPRRLPLPPYPPCATPRSIPYRHGNLRASAAAPEQPRTMWHHVWPDPEGCGWQPAGIPGHPVPESWITLRWSTGRIRTDGGQDVSGLYRETEQGVLYSCKDSCSCWHWPPFPM